MTEYHWYSDIDAAESWVPPVNAGVEVKQLCCFANVCVDEYVAQLDLFPSFPHSFSFFVFGFFSCVLAWLPQGNLNVVCTWRSPNWILFLVSSSCCTNFLILRISLFTVQFPKIHCMSQHSVTVSWKVAWKACLKPEVTPKCFKNSMVVNAPLGSDSCSLSHCKDPGVHVTCQSREGHGNVLNKYMKWPDKNQYRCKHRFEVILVCPTYHLPVHCCISDCRGHLNSYAGLTITYAGMAQPVITRHHHYCLVGICLPYAHTIYKISLAANCRGGGGGGGAQTAFCSKL